MNRYGIRRQVTFEYADSSILLSITPTDSDLGATIFLPPYCKWVETRLLSGLLYGDGSFDLNSQSFLTSSLYRTRRLWIRQGLSNVILTGRAPRVKSDSQFTVVGGTRLCFAA